MGEIQRREQTNPSPRRHVGFRRRVASVAGAVPHSALVSTAEKLAGDDFQGQDGPHTFKNR